MIQIIGKGGFAREVAGYAFRPSKMFENEELKDLQPYPTVIAIGDPYVRKKIANSHKLNYTIIFRGVEFGENYYGEGTIICPGTVLTTGIRTGDHVIINLNCTVGHDCIIGDFVTISPGANISGNVAIGNCCYIGTNAVIKEKITICRDVIIGAGTVVVKDITEPGTYVGNPAKKIK